MEFNATVDETRCTRWRQDTPHSLAYRLPQHFKPHPQQQGMKISNHIYDPTESHHKKSKTQLQQSFVSQNRTKDNDKHQTKQCKQINDLEYRQKAQKYEFTQPIINYIQRHEYNTDIQFSTTRLTISIHQKSFSDTILQRSSNGTQCNRNPNEIERIPK